jgi:predicted 2-oxoglutarate/Fe(II)-dependent dioxygenase YbiX
MSIPQRIDHHRHHGDRIVTVEGLLLPDECDDLVRLAESVGFSDAPITTGHGFEMRPEVRNNTRVILDDRQRAEALWDRVAPFAPPRRGTREAVGLNERFRFYRYEPGQYFRWHYDGAFRRTPSERSLITAMLYLNDGFEGGETEFDLGEELLSVTPVRGLLLLFDHAVCHQGAPVRRGTKYVLRSDVMYRESEG